MKQERVETIQTAVRLPREMHERLRQSDLGVSEEIRRRVERTFAEDAIDAPTQVLMHLIGRLAVATERQTGRRWWRNPAAYFVFRQAVAILLGRRKPAGDLAPIDPAELPADRPVAVTDLEQMAAGLEAIISMDRALSADEQLELLKRGEETRQGGERLKKMMATPPSPPPGFVREVGLTRSRRRPKGEDK